MNTLDVHASMNNLLQMDRHQEEIHRVPVVNQTVNAEAEREKAAQRVERPNETDEPEGKNTDSASNKRYHRETQKRKRQNKRTQQKGKTDGSGQFVDVTV